MTHDTIDLPNARKPEPDLLTGGQPSRTCLGAAHAAGYRTVVNLRPAAEYTEFDEGRVARQIGLDYISIPVTGPDDLGAEAIAKLDAVLSVDERRPVLIHCGSGNRVGALLAVHARRKRGLSAEQALACGERAGLVASSLHDAVRKLLQSTN